MSKPLLIQECMTLVPRTVGSTISVTKAKQLMEDLDIRHLPVLKEGRLVGLISERDINLAKSFRGPGELSVEDVMSIEPFVIKPDALVEEVTSQMVSRKFGSAIVQSETGKVVGIFTTTDALRLIRDLLKGDVASRAA